jgi:hypothetical protein
MPFHFNTLLLPFSLGAIEVGGGSGGGGGVCDLDLKTSGKRIHTTF